MSERIDHAAEAREWIDAAARHPGAISTAILAQAEAMLALVEQQRIANLIALSESGRTTVNGARAALSALYVGAVEDGTAHMQLRPDIEAALGIGDDDE